MVAGFELAIPVTADFEGELFTNIPADPGGPTKCGITLAWAQEAHLDVDKDGDVDVADIRLLDWQKAAPAYKERIWDPLKLDLVEDQEVATKLFDLAVNLGPVRSVRYFQRGLNIRGYSLQEDGKLGKLTRSALNRCVPMRLLVEVCFLQSEHYRAFCDKDPKREIFREGLMRRAAWPFWGAAAHNV